MLTLLTNYGPLFLQKILPILAATVGFSLVIVIHELGHFVFCKLFGVTVPSFSVGFGPVLLHKTIAGTKFQLALMPFGGYNEIKDETITDSSGKAIPTSDSFSSKPYWQKLSILSGGIALNLLLALVIFANISFFGPGVVALKEFKIMKVIKGSPAEKADLRQGFTIQGINDQLFVKNPHFSYSTFLEILQQNLGKTITLQIKNLKNETSSTEVTLNTMEAAKKNNGVLGVELDPIQNTDVKAKKTTPLEAIKNGFIATYKCTIGTFIGLKQIITTRSLESMGGPVMIISQSIKQAEQGLLQLLFFLAYISVSIAIINLFPLGALDGGRILLESAESLIGRPIYTLRLITHSGTVLLLFLIGILFYKDLYRLFFN